MECRKTKYILLFYALKPKHGGLNQKQHKDDDGVTDVNVNFAYSGRTNP